MCAKAILLLHSCHLRNEKVGSLWRFQRLRLTPYNTICYLKSGHETRSAKQKKKRQMRHFGIAFSEDMADKKVCVCVRAENAARKGSSRRKPKIYGLKSDRF